MPQMSPMSWETLFIMFIMLYLITNMMIYWTKEKKTSQNKMSKNMTMHMNWKW
uniref:ATP synthase F0 subunit 8 n=1 Tax=Chauliops fallax TaxID=1244200 RepID=M4HZ14_9HEMI|nr:ATP synthase F0 subunit 8 [Chauliops fallax]AFV25568.1 ATP synthase F0 subunit 8 [Chauliops fallax]